MSWTPTPDQISTAKGKFRHVDIDQQTNRFLEVIGPEANTKDKASLSRRWTAWLRKIDATQHERPTNLRTRRRGEANRSTLTEAVDSIQRARAV